MPEQLAQAVAAEVARLLDDRGMSGRELARRTGIPQRSMAEKLAGRRPLDLDDVAAVCRALDVTVPDLLSWAERSHPFEG